MNGLPEVIVEAFALQGTLQFVSHGEPILTIEDARHVTVHGDFYDAATNFWEVLTEIARNNGVELGRGE